jgi:hypothetical protein
VTTIGSYAFSGCSGFDGILTLPNSITIIDQSTFYGCSGFTGSLTIPNSVTTISRNAFSGCSSFDGILTIPNSVTSIGEAAFSGDFSEIRYNATNCSDAASSSRPFRNCGGALIIGDNVERIPAKMFMDCENLTSIYIGNSVTSIGDAAFENCSGITEVHYNARNCADLDFPTGGVVHPFIQCTGTLIIGDNVERIPANMFRDLSYFTTCNLIIPNSVTSIGERAFENTRCFTGNLIIPNSVTTIGAYAFDGCSGLTGNLIIGNSVTSIGSRAFAWGYPLNQAMTEVMMLGTVPPTMESNDVFVYYKTFCYVPYESLNAYKTATNWSSYESKIYPWMQKSISAHGTNENPIGWTFIGSPLTENTAPSAIDSMIAATANNYDLYRFNQSAELEWENWKNDDEVLNHYQFDLENGQGYLYANAEDVNLIFKGTFNEDDTKTVSLTYDQGKPLAGWNLVGNPFPVNAYANKSYYRMNDDGSAIYPTAVSTATAIAPCTGIMVKAETTGESVTFSKTTTGGQSANNGLLHIAVAKANQRGTSTGSATAAIDKAIVSFNEGNTLEKFVFNKDNAQLYIPQNGKDYAIAFSEGQGEMPLNFKATKDGTYTLSIDAENVEMGYLHLIDNMTGNDIDLLAAKVPEPAEGPATYTFNAKTTDYESRFKLVFSANNANNEDGVSTSSTAFAFFSDGNWIINNEGEATLQIVDAKGRILSSETINGNVSKAIKAVPGVYMIRLINGNDVKTQKIVVK